MKWLNSSAPLKPHNLPNAIKEIYSHFTCIQKGNCDFFQCHIICH